jgi:hypothetical protein
MLAQEKSPNSGEKHMISHQTSKRAFSIAAAFMLALLIPVSGCKSSSKSTTASGAAAPTGTAAGNTANLPPAGGAPGSAAPAAPKQPPPPAVVTLSAGSRIRVRLDSDLGSKISQPGDSFSATVADDVMSSDGQVIIPRGSRAEGTVIEAKALGHFKGQALLAVQLDRVHTQWGSYPVRTSTIDKVEKGKGKRSAIIIGGGAGLGALIGGLTGGGKGALIGGLVGGGAGTAGSAFTGNKQIVLPAETLLTFHLDRSVQITE